MTKAEKKEGIENKHNSYTRELYRFLSIIETLTVVEMTKSIMLQINKDNSNIIRASIDKEMGNVSILSKQKDISEFLIRANSNSMPARDIEQFDLNTKLLQISKDAGNYEHIFVVNKKGIIIADSDSNLINRDINISYNIVIIIFLQTYHAEFCPQLK